MKLGHFAIEHEFTLPVVCDDGLIRVIVRLVLEFGVVLRLFHRVKLRIFALQTEYLLLKSEIEIKVTLLFYFG